MSDPIACTGRAVDRDGHPYGPACTRTFTGRGVADSLRDEQARAAGWRLGPVTGGCRRAMCPACARPDPALTRICNQLTREPR